MSDETRVAVAVERISALDRLISEHWEAHDELHLAIARESDIDRERDDAKFAKANEVREQIDRERNSFATRKEMEEIKESFRRELRLAQDEVNRRAEVLERKEEHATGEKVGRATLTTPMQGLLFSLGGALALLLLERLFGLAAH